MSFPKANMYGGKFALWWRWLGVPTPQQFSSSSIGTEPKFIAGQMTPRSKGDTSKPPFVCKIQSSIHHHTDWFRIITWFALISATGVKDQTSVRQQRSSLAILPTSLPFLQARGSCQASKAWILLVFKGIAIPEMCHFTQPNLSFHLKVAPEFHSFSSQCSTSGKYWAGSRQLVENLHQDCMCSWATTNIGLHLWFGIHGRKFILHCGRHFVSCDASTFKVCLNIFPSLCGWIRKEAVAQVRRNM